MPSTTFLKKSHEVRSRSPFWTTPQWTRRFVFVVRRGSAEEREFLRRLRQARRDAGLTQEEVARRLGRSQSFVTKAETGERRLDVVELRAFAKIYRKPASYFLD